jgi:hypothetical protein
MGEDWTMRIVTADDPRLQALSAHGLLINTSRELIVERRDNNTTIGTIFQSWIDKDDTEELKVDTIALTFKQFLERRGIDLSKLLE